MKKPSVKPQDARAVAFEVVRDVFGLDPRRAQEALAYRLARARLDARDRAFATELAYGVVKMRRLLDWFLQPYVGDREKSLPASIQDVLRLGVYQLRCMNGVEPHAAVYETVNLALRHGHRGTAGLVNAVLRRFIADAPADPRPEDFTDVDEYYGVRFSLPTWIVRRLREQFDPTLHEAIFTGINASPQHAVRFDPHRISAADAISALEALGVRVTRSPLLDDVLICEGVIPEDPDARWIVQSESACIPVDVLAPRSDERVVELCSGRGNKTAQIVARAGRDVRVESLEMDPRKARVQQALLTRIGATGVASVIGDARTVEGEADADAVLLDAPCSGLGILGRHPEARWRKWSEDPVQSASTQTALLRAAVRRLKSGGRLVYSVCSTDPREGAEIIEEVLRTSPELLRRSPPARYQGFLRGQDLLVPPGLEGRDGFYVAMLERA